MTKKVNLGGDRLGSGAKNDVYIDGFQRSNHDLSYKWRSSMSIGTLVPFMNLVSLPGDIWEIDLNAEAKTLPTIGPLFGGMKMQLDVFRIPYRLYISKLRTNLTGVGMDMSKIKIPQIQMTQLNANFESETPLDVQQINPSCIFAYLGMRGLGITDNGDTVVAREFNAVDFMAYCDLYKYYYANKQEEIGAFINYREDLNASTPIMAWKLAGAIPANNEIEIITGQELEIEGEDLYIEDINLKYNQYTRYDRPTADLYVRTYIQPLTEILTDIKINKTSSWTKISGRIGELGNPNTNQWAYFKTFGGTGVSGDNFPYTKKRIGEGEPQVDTFPLKNIDDMTLEVIASIKSPNPFIIDETSPAPYGSSLLPQYQETGGGYGNIPRKMSLPQQGLFLKTYQSDMFQNWLNTEFIDGIGGVTQMSSIDVSGGILNMDTLNVAKKIYKLQNKIVASGGTYNDWMEVVYGEEMWRNRDIPMYEGGLSKDIGFAEVISQAESGDNPQGNLSGRGVMGDRNQGGRIRLSASNEIELIMGIVSITPYIDYSQGNLWHVNLKNMDEFHKPDLDQIGFQDLITDAMAWWDTRTNETVETEFRSAGKVPAWLNYMTNVDRTFGNFAIKNNQMFMTLNRRYEIDEDTLRIKDLTTYIDPSKFNYAFAQTDLNSQNFWVQIASKITCRRKMSGKVMPNLN